MQNIVIINNEELYKLLRQAGGLLSNCNINSTTNIGHDSTPENTIFIVNANHNHPAPKNNEDVILLSNDGDDIQQEYTHLIKIPYRIVDLIDKIQSIISTHKPANKAIKVGNFLFYPDARSLTKGEATIQLTEKEAKLVMFLNTESRQVSKDEILKQVWEYDDNIDTHTVETHIYRIRQKTGKEDDFIGSSSEGYFML